jgi:hypothetical protein
METLPSGKVALLRQHAEQFGVADGAKAINGGLLLIHAFVLYGALMMYRARAYRHALTAAIVSLIPFCSPIVLVGIPFSIWALAVMFRRDVREAFH